MMVCILPRHYCQRTKSSSQLASVVQVSKTIEPTLQTVGEGGWGGGQCSKVKSKQLCVECIGERSSAVFPSESTSIKIPPAANLS